MKLANRYLQILFCTLISLPASTFAAEQACKMTDNVMYDGLLARVPFLKRTRTQLVSARSFTLDGNNLSMNGRTITPSMDGSWKHDVDVRCERNGNDWSPCGEPAARFTLKKISDDKISGSFGISWEYGSLYPPIFRIEYQCTAISGGRAFNQTSKVKSPAAKQKPDTIKRVFNSYSIRKRKDIQSALQTDGYYTSSIDGLYGSGTRRAIMGFAAENGYSVENERGVTTALAKVLEETDKDDQKQVVVATTVNVTKTEPKVDTTSSTATTKPISTTSTNSLQKWESAQTVSEAQRYVDEVQATIVMYMAIREVVDEQPPTTKERVLGVVDNEISRLQKQKTRLQDRLTQRFTTPIKPSNANLQISAFRASDTFPKVPFYIPGTNEIGETLVTPRVSDEGYLNYKFDFIDPVASYDNVRDTILIPHNSIDELINGMGKIDKWTQVAQENGVNRRISKAAACIPTDACEVKKAGISSTELLFQVYEDGSTSGRMQINKGQFNVGYNMSVESTILLQAYLIYMREIGSKEFNVGVMSDEEVLELFD